MIATPACASCRTTLNRVSHSAVESADVGSSMIKIRASSDSALAISTNCRSPILSSAMRRCASISMPSRFNSAVAAFAMRLWSTRAPRISGSRPREKFSGAGHFGTRVEFLVDDRDASSLGVLNAREANRRTLDPDFAVIIDMHAGEDLHQGRFARAVLTHKRVDFAASQVEVDVAKRRHSGKGFGYAFRFKDDGVIA